MSNENNQGKIIAWIEDDVDVIAPVVRPLEKAGYTFVRLRTIGDAIKALDKLAHADLILLDMILPPGNAGEDFGPYPGKRLLGYIREQGIETPIIVFTVLATDTIRQELERWNVADVIRKPVRPSELKRRVEKALEAASAA